MDNSNAQAATAGLPRRTFPLYAQIISQATGVADAETLAMIEAVMRHDIFHSTLDWQTREQLADGARKALELLNTEPEPEKNEGEGAEATFGNWEVSVLSGGTQWQVCDQGAGDWIADVRGEGHAKRIVACVNACEGVPDSSLASNGAAARWLAERNTLASRNATLLALLERALPFVRKAVEEANAQHNGAVFTAGMAILREANVQIDAAAATVLSANTPR